MSWWRGRRIVSYAVQTVRASADARAQRVLAGGEWRIRFVDEFPMTVTGKLQKFRMREMAMEQMQQES